MTELARHFRNNKTGEHYYVLHVAKDCTNARDGNNVVVYRHAWFDIVACKSLPQGNGTDAVFTRDLPEFLEKFTEIRVEPEELPVLIQRENVRRFATQIRQPTT